MKKRRKAERRIKIEKRKKQRERRGEEMKKGGTEREKLKSLRQEWPQYQLRAKCVHFQKKERC